MQNSDLPTMTVGQKIKHHRERSGKSRPVLAGLVGKSPDWVKKVENGALLPPRAPMLERIAKALSNPHHKITVADLYEHATHHTDLIPGPCHPALPQVRAAFNHWPDSGPAEPLAHIRSQLHTAWRTRHASPHHRTVLGQVLPTLLHDTQHAATHTTTRQRRQAQTLLANTLGLAQMFLAYQPDGSLVWRAVDRQLSAAHSAGDVHAIAVATWFAVEAHRDAGDWDTATTITTNTLRLVERTLAADPRVDLVGMCGALQAAAAYTAAAAGDSGRAHHFLDLADATARRLPVGYAHPWTWFGRPVVGFYAVTCAVELRRSGEAVRVAAQLPPEQITSVPRRARHMIEVARGYHQRGDHTATMAALNGAYSTAPETIRWNGYARRITLDLLETRGGVRAQARDLATRVGLLGG